MCCDPNASCGSGFCITALGPNAASWCGGFGKVCDMSIFIPTPSPTPSPTNAPDQPTDMVTPEEGGGGCFSENASVQVLRKGPVRMKDLQVGQKIFVGYNRKGDPSYETVYAFGHKEEATIASYLRITTELERPLEITGDHLVFVYSSDGRNKEPRVVRSDSLQVGDALLRKSSLGGETEEVIHAMACHHGDYDPETVEAVLVTASDALSAARPGARREVLETYVKRLEKLEEIAGGFKGVQKSFAIQAGREIRVIVDSKS